MVQDDHGIAHRPDSGPSACHYHRSSFQGGALGKERNGLSDTKNHLAINKNMVVGVNICQSSNQAAEGMN